MVMLYNGVIMECVLLNKARTESLYFFFLNGCVSSLLCIFVGNAFIQPAAVDYYCFTSKFS